MADVLSPTTLVNTMQAANATDFAARQLAERALIEQLEAQIHALESSDGRGRGFEIR